MDRRTFLGTVAATGAATALGGWMGITQYDAATDSYRPARCMTYDESKIMPYWKGTSCYQYDSETGQYIDAYLPDGLVAYWDFQPSSIDGNTVKDRSINHNDGTIHGNPSFADGIVGREMVFDRDSAGVDFVEVPFDQSLNIQSGDFTISVWCRVTNAARKPSDNQPATEGHGVLERKNATGTTDTDAGYMLQIVPPGQYGADLRNIPAFTYNNAGGATTLKNVNRVPTGIQMHLLVTFDSSTDTATLFVDGYNRGSNAGPSPVTKTHDLLIGTHRTADGAVDRHLDGAISEIRLYDRKLSRGEIGALAGLGMGGGSRFTAELQDVFFHQYPNTPFGRNDAVAFYDETKAKPYRLVSYGNAQVNDYGRGNNLHESDDLNNWNLVAKDIKPSPTWADGVYHNGTYYIYAGGVELWTGDRLDNLTKQAYVGDYPDLGVYHENGTWYLFPEEAPVPGAPSGNKIGVWTSDRPDGGFARQGTAVDLTDRPHLTGDADIIKHDGKYWLFADAEHDHPFYGTMLARSDNLIDWEYVTDDIKSHVAGDLQLVETPTGFVGFTEFTADMFGGIGVWDVTYIPET